MPVSWMHSFVQLLGKQIGDNLNGVKRDLTYILRSYMMNFLRSIHPSFDCFDNSAQMILKTPNQV